MSPSDIAETYITSVCQGHLVTWHGRYWIYRAGRYIELSAAALTSQVCNWACSNELITSDMEARTVVSCIRGKTERLGQDQELPSWLGASPLPGRWLPVANGLIDPTSIALSPLDLGSTPAIRPHTPDWFDTVKLPTPYDPKCTCPKFVEWLTTMLPDEANRDILQEFVGYWLSRDTSRRAVLCLVGKPGSGKSTFCNIMDSVFGATNVSHAVLSNLKDRFSTVQLMTTILNISDDEEPFFTAQTESTIKRLTGDTRAQHEYKYGEIFSGGINARLCVCFNEAPRFRDKSGAIQQRMRFVPFDNPIPESQWDTTLRARLATEASGILNWGLVGLARLIAQRRFTLPTGTRSSTAVINESIRDWMTRCVAARRGACMPWGDILASYTGFCSLYGYMPSSITNLKSALRCEFESEPTLSRAYANASETSVPRRCWTNLTLHPPTSVQTSVTKENDA